MLDAAWRTALGVAQFGQSGSIEDLYRYNGIDTDSVILAG
jgi:pyruvate dehydrogenase E1 component